MLSVPRPDDKLVGGWQASLDLQVKSGDLPGTTKRTFEWGFAQFLDWLDHQQKEEISGALIYRWIESLQAQGYNSFSIGFWLDCLKNFFAWAKENGFFAYDPTRGILPGGDQTERQIDSYSESRPVAPLFMGEVIKKEGHQSNRTRPPFSL